MNKKVCFILLPIIALLCVSCGMLYYSVSTAKNFSEQSATTVSTPSALSSGNLKKQEKKIDINAMRIKAKRDVVAINVPPQWALAALSVHYNKPYNSFYCAYELCAFHAGYHLRGPPALV